MRNHTVDEWADVGDEDDKMAIARAVVGFRLMY